MGAAARRTARLGYRSPFGASREVRACSAAGLRAMTDTPGDGYCATGISAVSRQASAAPLAPEDASSRAIGAWRASFVLVRPKWSRRRRSRVILMGGN